ncbi:alpha/beta hydrolase [Agromyces endophyticus]|uniref:alpha/beta fold hydrolase n=1 Tax=Agromyces sp. H17E-10 TaxID=2932244 RepID=UPI001FD151A0|nr:alpha/beta hydrolase [Agromyces sp. H17E-10]UOQ87985.1 alpha/beta hydrolase [Agromyces sp. H17E-10]
MLTFTARDGREIAFHLIGPSNGDASAIVVPGGPCRGAEYLEDLAGVADATGRTLAVLHPRGTPSTGGLSRGWWTDADDLVDLADHLGLDEVELVAHSAGTRLALAAWARTPDRVRRLALVTPAAAWFTDAPRDSVEIGRRRNDPLVDRALDSLTGPEPRDQAEFELARELEGPAGYARWTEREQQHAAVGGWSLAALDAYFTGIPDDAVEQIRSAPRRPALVIAGDEDILVGVRTVEAYADAIGAELRWLDDCGHYPWVEQPEAFRAALGDWLRAG